jgi:hypothetical protein
MQKLTFSDAVTYDGQMKSAISVRDGVLEYLGSELCMEPADRIFYVYRSPATIASAANLMPGIPLLGDHVEPGTEGGNASSRVESASLVDAFDEETASTLAIKNTVSVDDQIQSELESGKRELSLGYTGNLVPHSKYDFEQRDIIPTHLAVVERGRCGSGCRFLDRKPTKEATMPKMHKAFTDADGAASLSQIVEIAAALPEAIKSVPVDKLQELMPALQEIMDIASAVGIKAEGNPVVEVEEEMIDEDMKPAMDEKSEPMPITDSAAFKDAIKGAVAAAVKEHAVVIDKARDFVDEGYCFTDKSTVQVMRDALASEHGATQFTDAELPVAFKLLKKASSDYKNFADHQAEGGLSARVKESMKGDQ